VLTALLFVPALVAIAFLCIRWRRRPAPGPRVLAEAAPPAATVSGEVDPVEALDALLAELEQATVRLDGADELGDDAVVALERLADRLEAAAASFERVT
jgi:hypothetical protein